MRIQQSQCNNPAQNLCRLNNNPPKLKLANSPAFKQYNDKHQIFTNSVKFGTVIVCARMLWIEAVPWFEIIIPILNKTAANVNKFGILR